MLNLATKGLEVLHQSSFVRMGTNDEMLELGCWGFVQI